MSTPRMLATNITRQGGQQTWKQCRAHDIHVRGQWIRQRQDLIVMVNRFEPLLVHETVVNGFLVTGRA